MSQQNQVRWLAPGQPSTQDAQLQLTPLEGSNLSKLIAPALEAVGKDVGTSPFKLAEQLAADIQPILQGWLAAGPSQVDRQIPAGSEAQLSVSALQLNESIVNVVKPSLALWLDSKSSESNRADLSIEVVAENVARIITPKILSAPALNAPDELRRELEVAVAQWVQVSPLVDGISVSDAWIRDAAQRVAPAVSEWTVAGTFSERQANQLAAQITPADTGFATIRRVSCTEPVVKCSIVIGYDCERLGSSGRSSGRVGDTTKSGPR